jgi:hypothetical protein
MTFFDEKWMEEALKHLKKQQEQESIFGKMFDPDLSKLTGSFFVDEFCEPVTPEQMKKLDAFAEAFFGPPKLVLPGSVYLGKGAVHFPHVAPPKSPMSFRTQDTIKMQVNWRNQ